MKTHHIILLFCIAIASFACKTKTQNTSNYPIHINFGKHVDHFQEIPLSKIADSVVYIKLENRPECFVDNPSKVIISDDYIFTMTRNAVLQFDKKGKFIRQIGSNGKGPEEYSRVLDLFIDQKEKKIFVNAGNINKIQIYNFEGKHLAYQKYFYNDFFSYLDSNTIVSAINNLNGQKKNQLLFTSPELDTLGTYPNTVFFPLQKINYCLAASFKRNFYTYQQQLYFNPTYNDTIYHIKNPNQVLPKYIIDKGKYKLPLEYRLECLGDFQKYFQKAEDYYLSVVHELDDYVLISYVTGCYSGKTKLAIYNKHTGECYSAGKSKKHLSGFTNDLDGFGTFVHHEIQDDKYMVAFYEAVQLTEMKEALEQHQANSDQTVQLSASYQKLMDQIKEDDNLVVQVVYLKS